MPIKKTSGPVRGALYTERGHGVDLTWVAEVTVGEHVVWMDDCTDPAKLIRDLECTVYAFRRLQALGQKKFLTWAYVSEKAGKHL